MVILQVVLACLCGLVGLATVVDIVRNRTPDVWLLGLVGLVELGLVAHLVAGFVRLSSDHGDVSGAVYGGYLVGVLLVLPAAFVWSLAERSRSGTAVLLVGAFVTAFLLLRVHQVWVAGHVS